MDKDIAPSSVEITETKTSSSSSSTPAEVSAFTDNTYTEYEVITSALPVSGAVIETGSQTYRFECYSIRGLAVGTYLASTTFIVGGYKWEIILYPNGNKEKNKGYMSLYARLKSDETDVNALFKFMLVDQSGEGKHKIRSVLGRGQENQQLTLTPRRRNIKWGFSRYIYKTYLKKLGYLKNDCVIVKCVVRVLPHENLSPVRLGSSQLFSSVNDLVTQFTEVEQMKESNCKDTKLSYLWSMAQVIIDFGIATELRNDGNNESLDNLSSSLLDIMSSFDSGMILDHQTPGTDSIKMLQLVFRDILDCSISMSYSESFTSYSSFKTSSYSYDFEGDNHAAYGELSLEQVYYLRSIIERLNSLGCLGDCNEVYRVSRKSAVDARLLRFDITKWSINYLKALDWEEFTRHIKMWILAAYNCHNIFPGERHYYEQIFAGVGAVTYDNCFLPIVRHVALELISSVEAITCATSSFQNLFNILDLYEAMLVVLPDIEATFHTESSLDIHSKAIKTVDKLTILARKLFVSFEDTVRNEQSNTPAANGEIHSMTRYVMDYVSRILQYEKLLTDTIVSMPTKTLGDADVEQFLRPQGKTLFDQHMTWIIISLKVNLEEKSCHYKDPSLQHAFILCNINYIVRIVNSSPKLPEMIGKKFLSKLSKDAAEAGHNYVSCTWNKVLYCLGDDGLNQRSTFYSAILGCALKQRLKKFNELFEEVCVTQRTQLVSHSHLRAQLTDMILRKLIPAYKSFIDKFARSEKYYDRYIKYSPQDLANKVHDIYSYNNDHEFD